MDLWHDSIRGSWLACEAFKAGRDLTLDLRHDSIRGSWLACEAFKVGRDLTMELRHDSILWELACLRSF
jgi:hypothetical protein